MAVVLLPLLLPVYLKSGGAKPLPGLDIMSIANFALPYTATRLWVPLAAVLSTSAWVCYVAYQELRFYVSVKQVYMLSPQHHRQARATTILIRDLQYPSNSGTQRL